MLVVERSDLRGAWAAATALITVLSAAHRRCRPCHNEIGDDMHRVAQQATPVTVGVDTHQDTHAAAVLDQVGQMLDARAFPATPAGYRQLLDWAAKRGPIATVAIEGANTYGAGLTRTARAQGLEVVEVTRPERKTRDSRGKSDPIDAEAAARAALAGTATVVPKTQDGRVEMLRALKVTRDGAVKARTQTANQLHALVTTAPDELRTSLGDRGGATRTDRCARLRPGPVTSPKAATKFALRQLGQRHQQLGAEVAELDVHIEQLVRDVCPQLLEPFGIGVQTAATLLITAGDNPDRLRSEAAFANLCGVSPIPASSGRVQRHRLNSGGDRDANRALWTIAMVRLSHQHPPTIAYRDRRLAEGKTI
ncbi:MAG TPA: IS110 family transposase, partial [Nitriliruptorales bacterium]